MINKRNRLFFPLTLLLSICVLAAISMITFKSLSAENNSATRIYIASDSTAASYDEDRAPRMGWGQVLDPLFDEEVAVMNRAASGRSTKSFIDEGRLKKILREIREDDYLFIQFGHNDSKEDRPNIYTEPFTSYQYYLKKYIDGARAKGAIPVLITPVERRTFTDEGDFSPSHGNYPKAMKELAVAEDVLLIDLTKTSAELLKQIGAQKSKDYYMILNENESANYPDGIKDNVHFSETGAKAVAKLIAEGIDSLELTGLTDHLIDF